MPATPLAEIPIAEMDVGLVPVTRLGAAPGARPLAGSILQDDYDIDGPWHSHDMHQIQYAFAGSIELEDAGGRHLLPQSLAGWIPAGVRHRDSLRHIRSVSLLLAPELVPQPGDRLRVIRVSPLLRAMIAEAMRWPIAGTLDETGRAFFIALGHLLGDWIGDEAPFSLPATRDPALKAATDWTRAHLAEASLSGACRAGGLSERSLRRRCQALLGMTWDEYRRRARLLAAIDMLAHGQDSIARVAAEVGFESQSAFAKAFRQFTGETPARFRRRRA